MKKILAAISSAVFRETVFVRLIASWCAAAFVFQIINLNHPYYSTALAENISLPLFAGLFALIFAVLAQLHRVFPRLDLYALAVSVLSYGALVYEIYSAIYIFLAIMAVVAIVMIYLFRDDKLYVSRPLFQMSEKTLYGFVIAAAAVFLAYTCTMCVLRFVTYSTPCYDFGIFSQMFYYMKKTFLPLTTCERSALLSHFAVHISPIYYLILPIYLVFPYQQTLIIVQALALASGVIPLFKLAVRHLGKGKMTAAVCAMYLAYPALVGGMFYDLHENKFLTPLLLWLLYFLDKKSYLPVYIFAFLTFAVKEDAPIYIAFIALYIIVTSRDRKRHGFILFGLSVAVFALDVFLLSRYGTGAMISRYSNFSTSFSGLLKAVFVNPAKVLYESLSEEKLTFIVQMLLPLGLIPLCGKKFSNYILLCPMLLMNLMTSYIYQYSINFQYTYGVTALLFYLLVINLPTLRLPAARTLLAIGLSATLLTGVSRSSMHSSYVYRYISTKYDIEVLDSIHEIIPADASLSASSMLLPNFAQRDEVYKLTDKISDLEKNMTEYLLLDRRPYISSTSDSLKAEAIEELGYELIESYPDVADVYKLKTAAAN